MGMLAIFALLFTSCSKEETNIPKEPGEETAVLSFGAVLNDLANRSMTKGHFDQIPTCSSEDPAVARIQFSYGGNTYNVDVDILEDEQGYFTDYAEELKIPVTGASTTVTLEEFMVYNGDPDDENTSLIWIAPIASEENPNQFDGYVDNPLPFDIIVQAGTKPYIDVEVLCFDRRNVNEYGYPFFDIIPGQLVPLCFFANYCPTPDGRHFVGNYSVALYYLDGEDRVTLYSDSTPDLDNDNNSADPVCLVVPESPFDNPDEDYLFYVITPEDWMGTYGDIDNTPLPEVGLSWSDVEDLLNDDGETNEYIHLFIGCDGNPGGGDDCTTNGGDVDEDGICDNEDGCINGVGPDCPGGGDDCTTSGGDADGDGICDNTDDCINGVGDGCDNGNGDDCDETAYVGSASDANAIQFNELTDGPNRWGFIYDFRATADVTTKTLDIYAGASTQYNLNDNTDIGDVTITFNRLTDEVVVTFDFENPNNDFDTLHVNISEDVPSRQTLQAPGQYNMNRDVEVNDGDSFTFTWTGDDSFFIVIHGEGVCMDM